MPADLALALINLEKERICKIGISHRPPDLPPACESLNRQVPSAINRPRSNPWCAFGMKEPRMIERYFGISACDPEPL